MLQISLLVFTGIEYNVLFDIPGVRLSHRRGHLWISSLILVEPPYTKRYVRGVRGRGLVTSSCSLARL